MKRYHLRRSDKQWNAPDEIEQLLASVRIMTGACCLKNEPYLFTVDFVWDRQARQLWFHSASEGRKMDIIKANPRVCVTVVEDRGYIEGECDHAYRSLILEGEAQVVTDLAEKRRGLELLARKHEPQPDAVLARFAPDDETVRKVGIVRITVDAISGKQGPKARQLERNPNPAG
jgi:nitroimidazol reductase NimA-like FMN-containing flavoprotein (pyridoxamine 5'-phosphate oxidase superfamily)